MCYECGSHPCVSSCPNAKRIVCHKCVNCKDDIYDGEIFYNLNGDAWCEECIDEAKTFADYEIDQEDVYEYDDF